MKQLANPPTIDEFLLLIGFKIVRVIVLSNDRSKFGREHETDPKESTKASSRLGLARQRLIAAESGSSDVLEGLHANKQEEVGAGAT